MLKRTSRTAVQGLAASLCTLVVMPLYGAQPLFIARPVAKVDDVLDSTANPHGTIGRIMCTGQPAVTH